MLLDLTKGKQTIIDDADFIWIKKYTWHSSNNHGKYYARTAFKKRGRIRYLYLHRVIAGAKKGEVVDHINRNPLDNRRANLRITTQSLNCQNRKARRTSKTGFRGVQKNHSGYQARIYYKGKWIELGKFETAEEAARVRDKKALELFGEHAYLNFPLKRY